MDLRARLLTCLLAGFAALLAVAGFVVFSSLQSDVYEELHASDRLVALMLRAAQAVHSNQAADVQALEALLAEGGLRHVQVTLERSDSEQLLQSATVQAAPLSWTARLAGLHSRDFPVHRLSVGQGQQLVLRVNPRNEVDEVLADAARMLSLFALFAFFSMLAAWWAADRALRPVRALEEGLARIGQGELDTPLPHMALREFQRVAVAIEHMAQSLAQARVDERRLGQRLMELQESEREDLARELHDEFGQMLTAMSAAAAFMERHAGTTSPEKLIECARDIRQAAGYMSQQVHSRLRQLRPHGLHHMNLRDVITELLCSSRLNAEGVMIEAQLPPTLPELSAGAGLALYRTVQEALTNVLKHAKARHVQLLIQISDQGLLMTLDDDGQGHPQDVLQSARAGVMGMRERAAMVNGRFELTQGSLGGLRVSLWLPLCPPHATQE